MGKPLLGLILITRMRASHGSCNHPDGLSPRKRKSESVIIGVNKSAKSAKSAVLLLASVFCLRQTQVFTSEPIFLYFFFLIKFLGALPQAPSAICRNKPLSFMPTLVIIKNC